MPDEPYLSLPDPIVAPAASAAPSPGGPAAPAAPATPIHSHALLLAHNAARQLANLPALTATGALMFAAQDQADWLARGGQGLAHTRPSGYDLGGRLRDYGIQFARAGENIAKGFVDADGLMQGWLDSPGHRSNILGDFGHVGFGIAGDSFVVVFARLR